MNRILNSRLDPILILWNWSLKLPNTIQSNYKSLVLKKSDPLYGTDESFEGIEVVTQLYGCPHVLVHKIIL